MRILQVCEACSAGVGLHVTTLSKELLERGHEVHLLYSAARTDARFLHCTQSLLGLKSSALPWTSRIGISDGQAFSAARRVLAALPPFDIIHGHSSRGGGVARLCRPHSPAGVVYTPNAFVTLNPTAGWTARWFWQQCERWLARKTDCLIAVSLEEKDHACNDLGYAPTRVWHIPNAIRPPSFPPRTETRRRLGIPDDAILLVFVGRLAPQKNPFLLLDVLSRLIASPSLPTLRLALVGSGPLETSLRREAGARHLDSHILWFGQVPGTQILPAGDILLLTSRYEGMPYVLLEALHAGVPAVTTAVGGTRELLGAGGGIIVDGHDAQAFAESICMLVRDPHQRERMARTARQTARQFGVETMVDAVLAAYESAAKARTGG